MPLKIDNNDALIKYSLNNEGTTNIDISSGQISIHLSDVDDESCLYNDGLPACV